MKTCKTCKEIKENREIFKGLPNEKLKMTNVAKVKITIRTYDRMNRKRGEITFSPRPLKFCPECGKPIERDKTVWQI